MMRRFDSITMAIAVALVMLVSAVSVSTARATASAPRVPTLREIRTAHHRGYDRLVFEFTGGLPERTEVQWVDRVIYPPSGSVPARVAGNAYLSVLLADVRAHRETGDFGSTFGPRRRAYDLPNIATVVSTGDFEAVATFGVGLMRKTSIIRTMRLRNPARYVIDVRTNFGRTRVKAWFLDAPRYVDNTSPFFRPVRRWVPTDAPAGGALHRMYAGPTQAERRDGLRLLRSRSRGFTNLRIAPSRIARVQLTGGCSSGGSTVTVADQIMPMLRQFPTVRWVKIYDPQGSTERPSGRTDSIPECLEP